MSLFFPKLPKYFKIHNNLFLTVINNYIVTFKFCLCFNNESNNYSNIGTSINKIEPFLIVVIEINSVSDRPIPSRENKT